MKIPRIISQEEFEKLFEAEKNKEFKLAYLLGFEAGMRISEIVGYKDIVPRLEKDQIDMKQHNIRVISGKGQKDRVVPLPKRFNKNAYDLLPLMIPRRTLQGAITRLGKRVLGKDISFHTLRHGFGTHLSNEGRPISEIQYLLGHSRLDTTGIYLHTNPTKAIEGAREAF